MPIFIFNAAIEIKNNFTAKLFFLSTRARALRACMQELSEKRYPKTVKKGQKAKTQPKIPKKPFRKSQNHYERCQKF
jgi:hypothetical protein